MTKGKDEVLSKIKNLLDLGANNTNQNEAAAALGKARELMLKYQVEEAELAGLADSARAGTITTWTWDEDRNFDNWERQLAQAVGVFCGAYMYLTYRNNPAFVVAEQDIEFLKYCLQYTRGHLYASAVAESMDCPKGVSKVAFRNSFLVGAARGFYNAAIDSRKKPMSTQETTALAVRRDELVTAYASEMMKGAKKKDISSNVTHHDAYANGYATGRQMQVLRPIEG